MMSKYDPWVNMLRTTVAAFAAGVGGADAVTVLPFDSPLGAPDAFGRRIARNTSHLLIDESHVATVADPAGGAYAVEKLTDDLAVAAWELFGRLEEGAGPATPRSPTTVERARPRDRDPQAAADRAHRVPEPRRDAPRARRPRPRAARYAATARPSRRCATTRPQAHVFLATMGTVAAAHRARDVRRQPARGRRHRRRRRRRHRDRRRPGRGVRRAAGRLPGRQRRRLRRVGRRGRGAGCARPVPQWVVIAGRPRDWADDSAAMGVDALDFLTRTREKLA